MSIYVSEWISRMGDTEHELFVNTWLFSTK